MIPWFHLTTVNIAGVSIQVWGLLVAVGFLVGAFVSAKRARRRGLLSQHIYDMTVWMLIAALIGARFFHVLFYDLRYYLDNPGAILAIWQGGLSIYGGFAGAVIAAMIYLRRHHLDIHRYASATIFGLPIGMAIGRLGCFLIHDHPGTATHFFLGVRYPDGVVRHDLGLYEALASLLLFMVFLGMARKKVGEKWYLVVFCVGYGVLRFLMDFLRVGDDHYLGLTPGQYFSVLLIAGGIGLWLSVRSVSKSGHPSEDQK